VFESSLIRPKKSRRRSAAALPLAVFFHLVVLGSVAAASYWNVSDVAEPTIHYVFFKASEPPPPPPARGSVKPPEEPQRPVEPPVEKPVDTPIQPEDVPEETPASTPTTADLTPLATDTMDTDRSGRPDGDPRGVDGGFEEGVPHSDGKGRGPGYGGTDAPADSTPIQFKAGMTPPEVIVRVQPRYTEAARKAGVQGTVIVEAIIDQQGRVTNLRVLKALPMGLDQAAADAVRQWRFKPAMLGTRPVKIFWTLTVNFQLQR
jgi:protein TonB